MSKGIIMACENCAHSSYCENAEDNIYPTPTECGIVGGLEIGYAFDHEEEQGGLT